MTSDFLLEILCEEIPARMQAGARNDLARIFAEVVQGARLETGAIETFSTPRRLVLIARDVAERTEAAREEVKGPRSSAPAQAIDGFLRKTGLKREQLEERGGVLFAVIDRPGRPAAAVMQDAIGRIFADFPWPKSMRWGAGSSDPAALRWVRPLQGIVAMLGEEIVPFEIAGVTSGATTVGHRFHHPGAITIGGAGDYAEKLRACHVIVDQEERQRIIREGAAAAAERAGLALVEDEGLVVENAGLTEWPVPLLGRFDAQFLDVPREVIVLTMRANQKYFACSVPPRNGEVSGRRPDGGGSSRGTPPPPPSELRSDGPPPRAGEDQLAPAFVCVANIEASDGGEAIIDGNRRVLAARLADARFFWEQDLKVPLEEQAKKLSGIVFHEKLGTVADKVERVAKLAEWLASEKIVPDCDPKLARRAAELAKADLVTGMVGEFPELQGVIGGYLARAQGEPDAVADAIRDHYKPAGQGDEVPTEPVTVAVALADKLDSLFSFFGVNLLPTGSKDPYALRRAGLGCIHLIEAAQLRFLVSEAAREWNQDSTVGPGLIVEDFLHDRLGVQMRDEGVPYDVVQASTELGSRLDGDLWRVRRRAAALQDFLETEDGADLLIAYKRAANILKKEKWEGELASTPRRVDVQSEEQALITTLDEAEARASQAIAAENFPSAMAALASLRRPIDSFFDHVTVNVDDIGARTDRLNLLLRFRDAVHRVADFSKIEG